FHSTLNSQPCNSQRSQMNHNPPPSVTDPEAPSTHRRPLPAFPDYLTISAADLGRGQPVKVRVKGDLISLAQDLAEVILDEIRQGESSGRGATLLVPVGPVDQYPILARLLNEQRV